MPSLNENLEQWNTYSWIKGGEEWSEPWGDASFQWAITIYPRVMGILPADRLVEIAPGFGRWTPFLLGNSRSYIGIDLSPRCVDYCQRTFGRLPQRPRFLVGDGTSLPTVEDAHTDLVFSFDSLVHAELDCLSKYAKEIHRVLRPGGHAFIHHSNMGEHAPGTMNPGWRGSTVSSDNSEREFIDAGLQVLVQERVPWVFGGALTDCFSLVRKGYRGDPPRPSKQFINMDFVRECEIARQMAGLYSRTSYSLVGK